MFELPQSSCVGPDSSVDAQSPTVQQIQQRYNVSVVIKQNNHLYVRTVIVRGSVCNVRHVEEATVALFELLTGGQNQGVSSVISEILLYVINRRDKTKGLVRLFMKHYCM